jgi:hypothetical protein
LHRVRSPIAAGEQAKHTDWQRGKVTR